jgi:hypothetical protein
VRYEQRPSKTNKAASIVFFSDKNFSIQRPEILTF